MKCNLFILIVFVMWLMAGSNIVSAQFTIKLPNIKKPIIKWPDIKKPDITKINNDQGQATADQNGQNKTTKSNSDLLYKPQMPTGTPVLIKSSMVVKTLAHDEYWKMPGQESFSSWVPQIRFSQYYNNEKRLNYTVEYFNPDGSAWFSEKLDSSGRNADLTVVYESPQAFSNTDPINTRSTNATGVYSFKITNQDTKEVLSQGKFKVSKFSRANRSADKNKFGFDVEDDWVMPYARIGFHHSLDNVGGMPPEVSVWLKGDISRDELEGRIFYQGRQIASTKNDGGAEMVEERGAESMVAFMPEKYLRRWRFVWLNFLFDNNGSFNRSEYPNAHFADKNPGDYTVKIYYNSAQIREFGFTIGPDGRIVAPAYSNQIFQPYYGLFFPVKVTAPGEKWNAASWKTESFYGNPLNGFPIQ
jgi:hypothetical protein